VKCAVKGRNINAMVLNEDKQGQEGIHSPGEKRPGAPEKGKK